MARQVIGNPFANQIPTVSATAQPVETYTPAVLKKGSFESLSALLTSLETKATPALEAAEERKAKAEYAEGVELYNKTRVAIGDAVRDGIIAEGDSPYLRKGYRISHLNAMSARYTEELNDALEQKKLYTNGNPDSIDKFTTQFYESFQNDNGFAGHSDVEIAEYFSTTASKANEAFRASWADKHRDWQKNQNYAAWANETSTYILTLYSEEDTEEERLGKEASFVGWVNGRIKAAEVDGMNREKVNETILNSVILAAYQANDPSMLDSLEGVITGTGSLATTLEAATAVYEARVNISDAIAKKEKAEADARLEQQNTKVSSLEASITGRISQAVTATGEALVNLNRDIDAEMAALNLAGRQGNAKAATLYRSLVSFRDGQSKAGAEFRGDADKAHAAAMNELKTFTEVSDVYDYLTLQIALGNLPKGSEGSLLSQWNTVYNSAEEMGLDWLEPNSPAKDLKSSFLTSVTTAASLVPDGTAGELSLQAGVRFDRYYQELKADWMEANPDKKFNVGVQYQIATQAVDLAKQAALPNDIIQSVGETMTVNQNVSDALSAAQSSAAGASVVATPDSLISIIEGGNP